MLPAAIDTARPWACWSCFAFRPIRRPPTPTPHLPIGTDHLNGVERAKLIAQRADVLAAPPGLHATLAQLIRE